MELPVAMPLSCLPLISDYTREAKHHTRATVIGTVRAIFFFLTDITDFLYFIGSAFSASKEIEDN